ncbi:MULTISPECIES: 50S ribosomal protein L9 [unclassified Thermosynechococcus]|uniref:50S ribosomal protein L9 n=1 Tax=unclassified Thermosynechococcus TaxID=2622553 RepID=UPI00267384A8|nr:MULTISPECIES: 50S ribosomal protein L9 [unclassified Thermosynechococcus]MDR5638345.1 50S ribosomal protein L9 [Thermosynechococcus sp. PP42]MDR7921034.1 50S ribosomal protein L9 [Thermosynechococcus sp. HY213]MDR7992390.1 50S ribosomal protein L9 [Thermosynechococcus sp. TG252]WKT81667.1 50S ribosomal protein L9 [Thermosynechococcus sp. PP45]WNC22719.1 50S ribosomal protein L9 [Thermosynechococcus sp. PP22]
MAKRVQVVLNETVNKLGRMGQVVEVAPGYARNYLFPRGIAEPATPSALRRVERLQEKERQRLAELKGVAEKQKATLEKLATITISMPVGEKDMLFGSVTPKDVADAIQAITGETIDRREITLPEIRKLGTYTSEIKLHPEVSVKLNIQVVAD